MGYELISPESPDGGRYEALPPEQRAPLKPPTQREMLEMAFPSLGAMRAMPHVAYGMTQPPIAAMQWLEKSPLASTLRQQTQQPESVDAVQKWLTDAYTKKFDPENTRGASLAQGIGSSILPGLLTGGFGPAATFGGRAAQGAFSGATQGALTPVAPGAENFALEKAKQIGTGAALGAGTSAGIDAAGRVLSPKLAPEIKELVDANITLTPGQRFGGILKSIEDKATSIPILGDLINRSRAGSLDDFNRAIYNRVLAPIGQKYEGPVGQKALAEVADKTSKAFDDVLAKSVPAMPGRDGEFLAGMNQLSNMVPSAQRQTFIDSVKAHMQLTPAGTLTPSVMKKADSELGRLGREYSGSSVASERELGRAYTQAAQEIRAMYSRANPELKPEMDAANSAWSQLVQLQLAAQGTKVARNEGVLTPSDFLKGIQKSDKSVRDNVFSKGEMRNQSFAQAADKVLSAKYPDSGTAGRLGLGFAAGGGLGMLSPAVLAGAGAAAIPYLPGARNAASIAFSKRPEFMRDAAQSLLSVSPYLTPTVTGGLLAAGL